MISKTIRKLILTQTTFYLELIQIKQSTKSLLSSVFGSQTRLSLPLIIGSQFIKVKMAVERKKLSKMRPIRETKVSLKRNVKLIIIKINRCTIIVKTFNCKVLREHSWEGKLQMPIYNNECSSPNPRHLSIGLNSTMILHLSNSRCNFNSR